MSVLMEGFILLFVLGVFFGFVFFLSRRQNRKSVWVKTVLLCLLYFDIEITYTSCLGRC